ncbi:hypothetical protein GALMADRAFT_248246 [Galerina marginata CBS 339.88]|uniref:DNA2/NAM7 helicase-like C-terminal domain-containing protein n=1 Tax=Galerina marginata (strain CBS 339.88) TaxID=685588 RepID=A0A067SXH3_GALM3|nr:hypothetical protein GALMADRAFT_248246 [Galerina marginata CBS 339.88]
MSAKKSLSATNLAVHQHLSCDLYIHHIYNGIEDRGLYTGTASPSELAKAQFKRGIDWESSLYSWLDRSHLLLQVPSIPLGADSLLENILADDRSHFFITGLTFWPPQAQLKERFIQAETEPLTFGLAKPDLLEIRRTNNQIQWRVIDAKAAKHVKTSHHVQIYFYTLCLNYILHQPPYHGTESAGVWLPPKEGFDVASPSTEDIKNISMPLLSTALDALLFRDLPKVISLPLDRVKWHYNPLCQGCRYESDCKQRTQDQGEFGSMPNISVDDARVLRDLLRVSRITASPKSEKHLPDIEELHELVGNHTKLDQLAKSSPTVVKRAKQILALPKKVRVQQISTTSPVVQAARSKKIQVIPRRNYTCPSREDIAVILSIVNDPSSPSYSGDYFCATSYSSNSNITPPIPILCSSKDIITKLAFLIRSIEAIQNGRSSACTSQFYVWSSNEQFSLQSTIINAALTSSVSSNDIRLCIGALSQGASLLQTAFQPVLLSGALLSFLGKGKRTKAECKVCLERMGLPSDGTLEVLRKRIEGEIRRLQDESSTPVGHEARRKELGQLPRIVVLKKEMERQLALPIPGYWDLPECVTMLLPSENPCPTDEQIFAAYKKLDGAKPLEGLVVHRNRLIYSVLKDFRTRAVSAGGYSLLVNEAKILSTQFMDLCKQPHIRKLFFMQQFEVLAKLTELWQSRIDSCPEAPTLEFCNVVQGANGLEYIFRLVSGTVDVPASDRDISFYDKLLVLDTPDLLRGEDGFDNLPVEALFDDLGVSGFVFPLNRYTKASWAQQDPRVQRELFVADVRNVYLDQDRRHTMVALRTWGTGQLMFKRGLVYRLSPRYVDFNTTKVLSALFEIDLCWGAENELFGPDDDEEGELYAHHYVPFLQLIIEPHSLGTIPAAKMYIKTENTIQRLFRHLKDLGNVTAGSLVLKASQHKATQRILLNRLSVIWGPPGTGKTYTISLSLLRLIEVERRHYGPKPKVVFITAVTHAAIEACKSKLLRLMDAYRSVDSLPNKWLSDVKVEVVSRGNDHPAPSRTGSAVQIYAGTIYQLCNFTKRHSMEVDCVIIDEAGQISLGSVSLVLRSLSPEGRIIIAGDSEQLAPILSAQYPLLKSHALFGSVLDCLMFSKSNMKSNSQLPSPSPEDDADPSSQGSIIQLTENFRLNSDLGEFVSTIYSRQFKPQKVQTRLLAGALGTLTDAANGDRGQPAGIKASILKSVQTFLVALSNVMLKQPQSVLVAPKVYSHLPTPAELIGTSDINLTQRPVSLALVRLRSWSGHTHHIPYERHVHGEAAVAAALVISLRRCCPDDDIFVATPHRIQREAVKTALTKVMFDDHDIALDDAFGRMQIGDNGSKPKITVDTIERLQGSEAAFVICLFSVPKTFTSDLGFLLERRRLNVAISRAKTLCILITSDEVLCPSVKVLADEETAKGYAFLKAYERRAWSYYLPVNIDTIS